MAALAANLPASSGYRRKVSEGTNGPIDYEFARQRVTLSKGGLPDRTVWRVIKRTLGAESRYAYAISHAPIRTPLSTFVWLSGRRWAIEQCFAQGKGEAGMDQYEVRKYPGWQHHLLMSMLAHFFFVAPQTPHGEKKHRRSRCRSCGCCLRWCYPDVSIQLRTSWSWGRGYRVAITAPISHIESDGRLRGESSDVVGIDAAP